MDQNHIEAILTESASNISKMAGMTEAIGSVCAAVVSALKDGKKVLTAGNGGSAAEALHMAEELVGRYKADRKSLPAISLTADSTAITCIGNDYGYDSIFSRQVEGLGSGGDVLILFTTSGNSQNLKLAFDAAKAKGMTVISLLGRDGGQLAGVSDYELLATGNSAERVQEVHQVLMHIILEAVEVAFTD